MAMPDNVFYAISFRHLKNKQMIADKRPEIFSLSSRLIESVTYYQAISLKS